MNVSINRDRWVAPILIVAVTTTVMGAFASMFAGGLVVTAFGLAWGLALGVIAARVSRRERWRPSLANGALLLASLVAGTLFGFGLLDLLLDSRLLATSPQDIATLIQPPLGDVFVVGLIALNTSLEWLLLPALVLLSWHLPTGTSTPRSRSQPSWCGATTKSGGTPVVAMSSRSRQAKAYWTTSSASVTVPSMREATSSG
jgi:hypothetical protein